MHAVLDDYQPDYLGRSIQGYISPGVIFFKELLRVNGCTSPMLVNKINSFQTLQLSF